MRKKRLIVIFLAVLIFLSGILYLLWLPQKQDVEEGYYTRVQTQKELEQTYTLKGQYEVCSLQIEEKDTPWKQHEIWYPKELETNAQVYPLVVMANGSWSKASQYRPLFDHLASWGFVVVGNEDAGSSNGASSAASLDLLLRLNADESSIFYQKIDLKNIGISGHSQGGIGAFNAVTSQENGKRYRALYAASAPQPFWTEKLDWAHDLSRLTIPCFLTAGTGIKDGLIIPLDALTENYEKIQGVPKVMAQRKNTDHGEMLSYADGYMTAWFCYWLKGDTEAGRVFLGADAEILTNENWQDVKKNT